MNLNYTHNEKVLLLKTAFKLTETVSGHLLLRPDGNSLRKQTKFAAPPLVSVWNDVETSAEILYWWPVTTQIWVVLLIGRAGWKIYFGQSYALTRSGQWRVISTEFLSSFLRRHFARKPVVASRNVDCFLRIGWQWNLKRFKKNLQKLLLLVTPDRIKFVWYLLHNSTSCVLW